MSDNEKFYQKWKNIVFPKLETGEIKVDELVRDLKRDIKEFQPFILEDTNYLDEDTGWNERLYHLYHGLTQKPACEICGNEVKYVSFYKGYLTYCSKECGGLAKGPKGLSDKSRQQLSKNLKETFEERGDEIIAARVKTYEDRTGFRHQMYNPEVVAQVQKSLGASAPLKITKYLKKMQNTNIERYNHRCSLMNKEVHSRSLATNRARYNANHWTQSDEGKAYLRELGLERNYGSRQELLEQLGIEFNDDIEYQHSHYHHIWKCKNCGNNFDTVYNNIRTGYKCPTCYPRTAGTSIFEQEIAKFVESLGFQVELNKKDLISPKEVDIYIPSKGIGIEFDGLYWHSEQLGIDKNYHLNKTTECKKKGINLIHIFEDEWIFKEEITRSILKYVLNCHDGKKVNARDCEVKEIDPKVKNEFLDQFHLQGKDASVIKLGAFYDNELLAVMTFSHGNISKGSTPEKDIWELNRFCINYNYHVPGVFSKLLENFKNNYEWQKIFTYADRRWSKGNVYSNLNFTYIHNTDPNYWYVNGNRRIHRFSLRKREDEPKELTEVQLRTSEGYNRIWDCGNIRFELDKEKEEGN